MGAFLTRLMHLFNPNPNPNPNPRLLRNREDNKDNLLTRLPSKVLVIILSKLDITTLCRCTAAAPDQIYPLLHQIPSLSTPLPTSLFHLGPTTTTSFHHRLLDLVREKLLLPLSLPPLGFHLPRFIHRGIWSLANWCFCVVCINQKTILPSGHQFFRRLTGLKSLEVDLPPSPHTPNPGSESGSWWFRWDAEVGSKRFFIFVRAKIFPQQQPPPPTTVTTIEQACEIACLWEPGLRHMAYQRLTAKSILSTLLSGEDLKKRKRGHDANNEATRIRYVGRDMFGRIRVMYGDHEKQDDAKATNKTTRLMVCYDPTTRMEVNDGSIQIGDVYLYFHALVDKEDEAVNYATDDLIKAYLGGDDEERKELREVVMKILDDKNNVVLDKEYYL